MSTATEPLFVSAKSGSIIFTWMGAEFGPTRDLSSTRPWSLTATVEDRRLQVRRDELEFVKRLAEFGSDIHFAVRWRWTPERPVARVALLARIAGPEGSSACDRARLSEVVLSFPGHTPVDRLLERHELAGWLAPFNETHAVQSFERRHATRRFGNGLHHFHLCPPLERDHDRWAAFCHSALRSADDLVLTAQLRPVGDNLDLDWIDQQIRAMKQYVVPADQLVTGGSYEIEPDEFAVAASAVFEQIRRDPEPTRLAYRWQLATSGMSIKQLDRHAQLVFSAFRGLYGTTVRPSPSESGAGPFTSAMRTLDVTPPVHDDRHLPQVMHHLTTTVNLREAVEMAVFPSAPNGSIPGYPTENLPQGPRQPPNHDSVFMSYAREDGDVAYQLDIGLTSEGISIWQDVSQIRLGVELESAIAEVVTRCRAVVVLVSRASALSPWVAEEVRLAAQAGIRIVQVLLDGAPPLLPGILALPMRGRPVLTTQAEFRRLARELAVDV